MKILKFKLSPNARVYLLALSSVLTFFISTNFAEAATMRVNPNTGVYNVGSPFTVSVLLNTDSKSVNAADGLLKFSPNELQVVSVSRGSSIFSLWTEEPKFSNSAGTISFGGGSPSGYKGSGGNIFNVVFRALGAGTPKITFTSGSVLAADGLGTNILTSMNGGSYTIAALTINPEPEYITPANTPQAPIVTSTTHPDSEKWYSETTARLEWEMPSGVTGVRTLLSNSPGTIPTIVYDTLISSKEIEDLEEGESYFHIQFRNAEGWGRVTHYRLGVDTQAPENISVQVEESTDQLAPGHVLVFEYKDTSPVVQFSVALDGKDPIIYEDEDGDKKIRIETLSPGHHTVVVEAFDSAGNSSIASRSFTVEAFEKPVFTEYPTRISADVIPALIGKTRPEAEVSISIFSEKTNSYIFGDGTQVFTIQADAEGRFVYIPPSSFETGVYRVTAIARETSGKLSEQSDEIKVIVEVPGYIMFGTMAISFLSVIIPLSALLFLFGFGTWYISHKFAVWRRKLSKESKEAEESLVVEFGTVINNLHKNIAVLSSSRKGKLTKAEMELISQIEKDLKQAQSRIKKEVEDIEKVINS